MNRYGSAFGFAAIAATSVAVCLPEKETDTGGILREASVIATAAENSDGSTIQGRNGWMFFAPEIRHLSVGRFWGDAAQEVSRATKPAHADPLPAILDFFDQLQGIGVELIVVPVPAKAAIYPENVFKAEISPQKRVDPFHREFFGLLEQNGVVVLDPTDAFFAAKAEGQVYCRTDTHWSGYGCQIAAELIADHLRLSDWYQNYPTKEFVSLERSVEILGDLAAASGGEQATETLTLRFVMQADGSSVEADALSPVILLGDSHNLVFHTGGDMHASGAGLPDQLALELGLPVDLVAVRGSGATPARVNLLRRARKSGYLDGKKAVVWCFSVREFTESPGWMKVPVVR